MGPGQTRSSAAGIASTARGSLSIGWTDAGVAAGAAWDRRLYAGLRVASVAAETREGLAEVLGEAGVEAEFFLLLVNGFGGPGLHPHARGESFLLRLEAASRRLWRVGAALEVAAQSYMTALEANYPGLRAEAEDTDPWWPPFAGYVLPGEPVELRLRRCGYAYRHVVAAHLGLTLEAVAEQMALLLHALNTLPPAGILPTSALYAGLYELTSGLQGYTIPTHIAATDAQRPGLLAGIPRLRALDAREDTALAADIAWAREQYAFARSVQVGRATQVAATTGPVSTLADTRRWMTAALRDWQDVLAALESLQVQMRSARRSS